LPSTWERLGSIPSTIHLKTIKQHQKLQSNLS
jgi:hypothetical protein